MPEVTFAVLGNTRPSSPLLDKGRAIEGSRAADVIGDVIAQSMLGKMDFVVHTGDMVTQSSPGAWSNFSTQFSALIDGSTPPPSAARRLPIIPVAGDRDCAKESSCETFAAVFPGFGVDIGYGRVATWQAFQVKAGAGAPWRVLVLDSNKKGLGSRWNEQVAWLSQQATDPGQGFIVLVHEPLVSLVDSKHSAHTAELVSVIETHAPLLSIKAVFSAGPSLTQAFLPDGAFGVAHIGAGGGGAPVSDLHRGIAGVTTQTSLAPVVESGVDALVEAHQQRAEPPSTRAIEEAMGTGAFAGYPRVVSATEFPTNGWWKVHLKDGQIELMWRALQPDGTFRDQARLSWSRTDGWVSGAR